VIVGGTRVREPERERREDRDEDLAERAGWSVGTILGLTIMAALLQLAISGALGDAADFLGARPLRAFGWGLVALFGLPIVGLILVVTILGIPLGLLLWLVLLLLLAAASVAGSYWLGLRVRGLFDSTLEDPGFGGRVAWTLAGYVGLGVISWVPFVGPLFCFLLGIAAIGALFVTVGTRFRSPRPVSAAI
jgi:hypothetical protein